MSNLEKNSEIESFLKRYLESIGERGAWVNSVILGEFGKLSHMEVIRVCQWMKARIRKYPNRLDITVHKMEVIEYPLKKYRYKSSKYHQYYIYRTDIS